MAIPVQQGSGRKKRKKQPGTLPVAPPSPLAGTQGRGGVTPLEVQQQISRQTLPGQEAYYPEKRLPGRPQTPGVEGYVPTPGTVAELPAGLELELEDELQGQMDYTLKNLVFAYMQVFDGRIPDFSMTADILASGEVEFRTKQEAVRFFQGIKRSYEASGREWELDKGSTVFGAKQHRTMGDRGFTAETEVLDPEMLVSFAPDSIEDLLRGPYMKRTVKGKTEMFRDGILRLDELLIAVPKQWAISQLGTRLQQRQKLWTPDADAMDLMRDLNEFLAERVPADLKPAPTARWQQKTEEALRFLQMMRASATYLASVKDGEIGSEEGAIAQGFLATQGFSDILKTLDEDIRFKAMPSGITAEQQRNWTNERAAAIEQLWVTSRNPGVSPRVAIHELVHLNPEAVTEQSRQMYGTDHMMGRWGAVKGFLGDAAEATQIDHLLESEEFKAAAGWAVPIAADIYDIVGAGVAPVVGPLMATYEWMNKYTNLFVITAHQIDAGSLYQNPESEEATERRENLFAEYMTAYHRKHGDTGFVGDFIEKWKFYWHNNEEAQKRGIRMSYTDELMRDTGMDPAMHPELAFIAQFGWESLRDWILFRGATQLGTAAKATRTGTKLFEASRRMAGSALHMKIVRDVARQQWETVMVREVRRVSKRDQTTMDDVVNPETGQIEQVPRARRKKAVRLVPNRDEFAGAMANIFGLYHEDAMQLAISLEQNIGKQVRKLDGTFGPKATIDDVIDYEMRRFTTEYKQQFDPESWAFWDNLRQKAIADPTSRLYIGNHPFAAKMLEKHYKPRKNSLLDRDVPYVARQVGFRIRTAFKETPGALDRIIDFLESEAAGLGEVGRLAVLKDLRDSGDMNRLANYMMGRYINCDDVATKLDLDRFLVAKQRALQQLGPEMEGELPDITAQRRSILETEYMPDAAAPDVTRRILRLQLLDYIDEWVQGNMSLTEAPAAFVRRLERHDPAGAQRWRSYVQVITSGDSDFVPVMAMYRKWMDPQINPDLRPEKGVALVDETAADMGAEKYVPKQDVGYDEQGVPYKPESETSAAFPVASRASEELYTRGLIKRFEDQLHAVGLPTKADMDAAERDMRIDAMMLKVAKAEAKKQGGKVTSTLTQLQKQAEDIFTAQIARDEAKRASGLILRKQYPRTKAGQAQYEAALEAAQEAARQKVWTAAEQNAARRSKDVDVLRAMRAAQEDAVRSYDEVVEEVTRQRAEVTRLQVEAARAHIKHAYETGFFDELISHQTGQFLSGEKRCREVVGSFARIPIMAAEETDSLFDEPTQDWFIDLVDEEAASAAGLNPLETKVDLKRAPKGLTPAQIVNFAYQQNPELVRWYAVLLQESKQGILGWDVWLRQGNNESRLAQILVDAGVSRWKMRKVYEEAGLLPDEATVRRLMESRPGQPGEAGMQHGPAAATAVMAYDAVVRAVDAGAFDVSGPDYMRIAQALASPMGREIFMHFGADMRAYAEMLTALAIRIDDVKRTARALESAKRARAGLAVYRINNPHASITPRVTVVREAFDAKKHPAEALTRGAGLLDDPRLAIPEHEPRWVNGKLEQVAVAGPIREALFRGDRREALKLITDFLDSKLSFHRKEVDLYGAGALDELGQRGFEARQRAMGYQLGHGRVGVKQSQIDMAEPGESRVPQGQELKDQGIYTADMLITGEDFIVNVPDEDFYAALFAVMDQIWEGHASGKSFNIFVKSLQTEKRLVSLTEGVREGKLRIPILSDKQFAATQGAVHIDLDRLSLIDYDIANPYVIEERTLATTQLPGGGKARPTGRVPQMDKTYYVIVDRRNGQVYYAGAEGVEAGKGVGGRRVVPKPHVGPDGKPLEPMPLLADAEAELRRLTKQRDEMKAQLKRRAAKRKPDKVKRGVPAKSRGRQITAAADAAIQRKINALQDRIDVITSEPRYRIPDDRVRGPAAQTTSYKSRADAAREVKALYGRHLESLPDEAVWPLLKAGQDRGGIHIVGEQAGVLKAFVHDVQGEVWIDPDLRPVGRTTKGREAFNKMGGAGRFREQIQSAQTAAVMEDAYGGLLAQWLIANLGLRAPMQFGDEVVGAGGWIIPATATSYDARRRIAGVVSPQRTEVAGEWIGELAVHPLRISTHQGADKVGIDLGRSGEFPALGNPHRPAAKTKEAIAEAVEKYSLYLDEGLKDGPGNSVYDQFIALAERVRAGETHLYCPLGDHLGGPCHLDQLKKRLGQYLTKYEEPPAPTGPRLTFPVYSLIDGKVRNMTFENVGKAEEYLRTNWVLMRIAEDKERLRLAGRLDEFNEADASKHYRAEWQKDQLPDVRAYLNREEGWGPVNAIPVRRGVPGVPDEAAVPGLHTLPEPGGPRVYDPAVFAARDAALPEGGPRGLLGAGPRFTDMPEGAPSVIPEGPRGLPAGREPLQLPEGRSTGRTMRESWEAGEISADEVMSLVAQRWDPKVVAAQARLAELRAAEKELQVLATQRFAAKVEADIATDEAMFNLKNHEAIFNGGVARDDLDPQTKDRFRRVAGVMNGTMEEAGKNIRDQIVDLEDAMRLLWYDPERAIGLVSQPAMEWQLRTWHMSRYNYSKMAKFHAGAASRATEMAWSRKWVLGRWSVDDFTTLYKTVVMFKVSTMLRIVLADEFIRMIVEDKINPLTAWKGTRFLRRFDKMPDDLKFKVSELIRESIEHPMRWIDPDYKDAFTVYEHIAGASRRDPTFSRFLLGKIKLEREGMESLATDVDRFLTGVMDREFYQGDQHLVNLIDYYRKAARTREADGDKLGAEANLFKAWYALGYLKGGPLRKTGIQTHRFVSWGDTDELFLQKDQDKLYAMADEGVEERKRGKLPHAAPEGRQGIRGDAGGLVDALYQQFNYFYMHPVLQKHWRPLRPVTKAQMDDLLAGKVPRGMEFGYLDKASWKSLRRIMRHEIGETFTDASGAQRLMTADLKLSISPRLWARSEGLTTGGLPSVRKVRDGVYSILDYASSKMNEMVYANAFMDEVNSMRKAFPERSIEDIENRAHFAAREHMERIQYVNMSYGAEEYLRNIFMFLPAYRQFYQYWLPYMAKHPFAATMAYRMNRDKEQFSEFQVGPLQLDLSRMSFLFNQSDNMVTGWLPSGAPLITFPVSALATAKQDEKDNLWGNLAGNWPFDFSGEYTALNSPLDKLFYGVTGATLPWPLGTDPSKNEWRALQGMREKLISEDKLVDEGEMMWRNRMIRFAEGGWNFLVPIGMRFNDEGVTQMVQARKTYNEATNETEMMEVLGQPGNEVFKTFIEWQNLPSYEQFDFLKDHPEIVPYTVSGFTARSDEPSRVGFLWSKMRMEGVPDPSIYADRVGEKYVALNKVIQALDARRRKEKEEAWWAKYKSDHEGDHNLARLDNEWQHSEGAFGPGGRFYAQGKLGYAELTRDINIKFVGIEDPFTGISTTTGDAYRYAKFMDQMGGATRKLLQMSPNYEMYVLRKLEEHTETVKSMLDGYAETRMSTRLRPSQIEAAGYSPQEAAAIHAAVVKIDRLWDAADTKVKEYGKGGYTTSEGRALRKSAILYQNKLIHSSPLLERFLGDNIGAMYGSTYLAKPAWEREDFIRLDKMDDTEREMFYHLTSEIDPVTKEPRWDGIFLPEKERRDIAAGKFLGYVPKTEGGKVVWYTKVNVGGVIGLVRGKRPKDAAQVELTWRQAFELFDNAFGQKVPTLAEMKQWRASMDALPQWSQDLIEEGLRAQAWKAYLKWSIHARRELRDTINEYYGDAPGFSLLSKFGTKWKKEMLRYGKLLGQYSPAFKREYEDYNGNNEMINSLLGWYL